MKTIRILGNKKFIIIAILLTVFLMMPASCQRNKEISETDNQSNEFLPEEKSSDNSEVNEDKQFFGDSGEMPPKFKDMSNLYGASDMRLLYKYEDIYMPFSYNKWYKYNPLTNKWYSFNPDKDEEHEINMGVVM